MIVGRMWTLRIVHFDINMLQENNFSDFHLPGSALTVFRGRTLHDADTHNLSRDRLRFLLFASLLAGEGCHVWRCRVINRSVDSRTAYTPAAASKTRVNGCFLTRHEERRLVPRGAVFLRVRKAR